MTTVSAMSQYLQNIMTSGCWVVRTLWHSIRPFMTQNGWHFNGVRNVRTALAYQWLNMIEVVDHAADFLIVPDSWLAVLRQAPAVSLVTGGNGEFYVDMLYTTCGNKVEEPQKTVSRNKGST